MMRILKELRSYVVALAVLSIPPALLALVISYSPGGFWVMASAGWIVCSGMWVAAEMFTWATIRTDSAPKFPIWFGKPFISHRYGFGLRIGRNRWFLFARS